MRGKLPKNKDMLTALVRSRLIALRDEADISEAALARTAGLVQQEVNRFFTGDMKLPRLDFMDALCRVFNRTLADVLAQDIPPAVLTKAQERFLVKLKTMTPAERNAFETLMDRDQGMTGSKR